MIIIGLGHRARHGKDTAAEAIVRHCNRILKPVLHMGWAGALYAEVREFLDSPFTSGNFWKSPRIVDGVMLPSWVQPDDNPAQDARMGRHGKHAKLLQWWGTEYRRAQDSLYWIKKGVATIKAFQAKNPAGVVLVSDTRFINEFDAIKSLGGYSIKVRRLNDDGTEFRDPSRDSNHISETEAETYNFDYHIDSKSAVLTEELAITTFEYIRALRGL